jgi:flagellar operon protein
LSIPGIEKNAPLIAIKPVTGENKSPITKNSARQSDDFQAILQEKTGLKFSNHALGRLSDRGVNLDDATAGRLTRAVQMADQKGSDQSLVLLDQLAFLVSVKNKTVITAVETANMKEGVFTKIDSAIIG